MTLSTRRVLRLLPALSVCMACSSPAPQAGAILDLAVARSDATNVVYFASPRVQQAPQFTASSPDLERRDQPVTEADLRILLRADALLKDESVWNRNDDRECADDEATGRRSLFCALQKACIDVLGAYDHRRAALQEVRFAVEDATRGQDFEHRLRDFNNLPNTRLDDAKRILGVATDRVRARLKSAEVSARPAVNQIAPDGLLTRIDHLVYATPDLQRGTDQIERLLGVRATPGGQHPGRGTRNALIALGPASYLEIIGPDPEQPAPAQPRPFGIDGLKEPRLVTWAAKGMNLDSLARNAARDGVKLGEVIAGSRRRADGVLLTWRYTDPRTVVADGVVPFVIDWGATPHPSSTATPGASLIDLRAEHPDPQLVQDALKRLGLELRVQRGARAGLTATVDSPRGRVELR